MYAVVLALSHLLVTSTTTETLSPIDVQRQYIEGLLSRRYLQASIEGCRCLTDLSCTLRCTEPMLPSALIIADAVLALKNAAITREHSAFDSNQRRRGQSLQPELIRTTFSPISSKMVKSYTEKCPSPSRGSVTGRTATAVIDLLEDLETLVLVIAVDEEVSQFKLHDFPMRPSLTVRELYIPLDDSLRLEQVLQRYAERRTSSTSLDHLSGVTHPISSLRKPSTKTSSRRIPPASALQCRNDAGLAPVNTEGINYTCRGCVSDEDLSPPEQQRTRSPAGTAAQSPVLLLIYRRCNDLLVSAKDLISYCLTSVGFRQRRRMETR
ncbi:unnamed protein product [Schistocephalus solidus]|uniref:Uncharacterized protein n=1 Tax=Schistocephalus solidus TaxID=70667 RepID=A0A3P7CTJ6_SCHSO|nr:unnamed protein product [Schistocephalus solidus]